MAVPGQAQAYPSHPRATAMIRNGTVLVMPSVRRITQSRVVRALLSSA
jgi:hypothetical protein